MPFPVESPPLRSRPRLAWTDHAGPHVVELDGTVVAGSSAKVDLVVADRGVSHLHAELAPRADGLWVKDLGSRNGTYVGGVKVERGRAPSGSTIRLGTTELAVTYGTPRPPDLLWQDTSFEGLVACSAAMREVFAQIAHLARGALSVVLHGEAGTGRRALARALHDRSSLRAGPFVVLDAATLPRHARRAAPALHEALEAAASGTLLVEEPAEIPLGLQRELAGALESGACRRVVTTREDLRELVNAGAFDEELYFRLAEATVPVPALRHRMADLEVLLARFLGDDVALLEPRLVQDLARLPWTGNVRELALFVDELRADAAAGHPLGPVATFGPDAIAETTDLYGGRTAEIPALAGRPRVEEDVDLGPPSTAAAPELPREVEPWFETGFKDFRERWVELGEREYLRRLLLRTRRSSSQAAREAGLERTYLYRLIKKHGV